MIKKSIYILLGTFVVYGILVATHRGEFWPFSIYPMFSQAGNPWTRTVVRDIKEPPNEEWETLMKQELPGKTFALNEIGINQNDLANFISKNEQWNEKKINGLRKYFKDELQDKAFLIFKVRGRLSEVKSDSVVVEYTPYIYIRKDTTLFNPALVESVARASRS